MIELRNIGKKYNQHWVLKDLNFKIDSGENLVISGPSGSGKTTLLRLIAGLETPDTGQIYINNRQVSDHNWVEQPYKRNLGVVFQNSALWPHLNVAQNILFGIQDLSQDERARRLSQIIKHIGLEGFEKRFPAHLSGGEARRVALARALVIHPDWLLMDEPLTSLDQQLKEEMLTLILNIVPSKTGLIYITHDLQEADRVSSDRIRLTHIGGNKGMETIG